LAAEFRVAAKDLEAPNSTGAAAGETETEISLVMVTLADAVAELSATLAACTETLAGDGRFAGAV
jgi:hypothetical protein